MKSRNRRRLKVLLGLVALYAAVGFFALPPILKWQLEERLTQELGRPVSVGQVRTNPFELSVTINRLNVRVPDGSETMVKWDRFYVNFDPLASIARDWVLGDFAIDGLQVSAEVKPDGSLSFSDLIEKYRPPEDRPPSEPSRPWRIKRLNVTQARIDFIDRSKTTPFQTAVGPVNFTVLDFRSAGLRGAPGRFEAVSESGEKLTWIGSLTASPFTSSGEVRLENLLLPKYAPYLAQQLNGTIVAGKLGVSAAYEIDLTPATRRMTLSDGRVQLTEFKLAERAGAVPMLDVGSLQIAGIAADGVSPKATIDAIRLEGGRLEVRREADGSLNVMKLLPTTAATRATAGATPAKPLNLAVTEITVRDFGVEAHDFATARPVAFSLSRVNGSLKNVSLAAETAMPLELTFGWEPRGTVRVTGNLMREPLLADLDVEAAWLALPPLSPYLEQLVAAQVTRGTTSAKGHVRVEAKGGETPDVTFSGDGRVENFNLMEAGGSEELASFSDFTLSDVKVATAPRLVISVADANLNSPQARIVKGEDGALNLAKLMGAAETEQSATIAVETKSRDAAQARPVASDITITRVLITGGEFSFNDRSLKPQVRLSLTQAGGTLRNFSSQHPELGSVELRALVNGTGPVTVVGRLNPLGAQPFADVLVEGKTIDLAPAGPYVARFAGYELEGGKLFLDVKAKLANERLDMRNTITLDQFALGRAAPGPDAVKLPVKLGIALLKDSDGKIVLDLPVQGSLADPQFDAGKVVGQVFTNLLTKAATSPFSLIGSMFGGGGEELAQQEFVPGEATPTEESVKRLLTVQRALAARPALNLEIEAAYDSRVDAGALKQRKFDELLRRELMRESGGNEPTAEGRARAIRRVFAEKFPNGVPLPRDAIAPPVTDESQPVYAAARESVELAAQPAAVEQPVNETPTDRETAAAESRGIFRRTLDLATLKGPRTWWSERRERKRAEDRAEEAAERRVAEERARAEAEAVARREAARRERVASTRTSPANAEARTLSVEEMERALADGIAVTQDDLTALAQARARRVQQLLMADGKVAEGRVKIAAVKSAEAEAKGARAVLHLK